MAIDYNQILQQINFIKVNEPLLGEGDDSSLPDVINRPLKEFLNLALQQSGQGGVGSPVYALEGSIPLKYYHTGEVAADANQPFIENKSNIISYSPGSKRLFLGHTDNYILLLDDIGYDAIKNIGINIKYISIGSIPGNIVSSAFSFDGKYLALQFRSDNGSKQLGIYTLDNDMNIIHQILITDPFDKSTTPHILFKGSTYTLYGLAEDETVIKSLTIDINTNEPLDPQGTVAHTTTYGGYYYIGNYNYSDEVIVGFTPSSTFMAYGIMDLNTFTLTSSTIRSKINRHRSIFWNIMTKDPVWSIFSAVYDPNDLNSFNNEIHLSAGTYGYDIIESSNIDDYGPYKSMTWTPDMKIFFGHKIDATRLSIDVFINQSSRMV